MSSADLSAIRGMAMNYANGFLRSRNLAGHASIFAVFLYGSAAAYHVGQKVIYNDFDVQIFVRSQVPLGGSVSTRGRPKVIGQRAGKKVEVMRNLYRGNVANAIPAIKRYARTQGSKRWRRIRSEPVIFLYPGIQALRNL